MNIGENLKKYRENREYSKLRLSKEAGLSIRTVRRIENNQITNPKIETLETLANTLDVTVEQLIAND